MGKIEFAKPPVIELVIGAQFNGAVFTNEHIYDYYQAIKRKFPKIQENPPLPIVIENVSAPNQSRILQGFQSRRFFLNETGNRLIQIQSDKLLLNWRKSSDTDEYPKFSTILKEFEELYTNISQNESNICNKLNQLEVTFVDYVFMDDFKLDSFNLGNIFNPISFRDPAKRMRINISFPYESINGNLTLDIRSAFSNKDQRKLLACETTCRGMKENSESITDWYNRAHGILFEFFIYLFSEQAKKIWGIKS